MDIIMLKNCDNQFRNKIFVTETRFSLELRNHTGSNQKQLQDLLVIPAVTAGRVSRNSGRGKQQPSFNI